MITPVVTPKVAQRILDATTLHLDQCGHRCGDGQDHQARVDRYADVMRAGEWISVAPITFTGPGGTLIDGCHRMLAIIESGCSIAFEVAFLPAGCPVG